MDEYKICWAVGNDVAEVSGNLSLQVGLHLKDGWIPQGSASLAVQGGNVMDFYILTQAMAKPDMSRLRERR